ncbi:MAG: beta-ketoacyl-[acyl-carrier-protein] synthase family protein [Pseudomonadota bacterium]|nr:MAG: beta-ketoacyl-[acyl-carrier-protein] synthase family protein [Pseudomonadota bacterium]
MNPLQVSAYTVVSAAARGVAESSTALRDGRGGLRACDFEDASLPTWIGRVDGIEQSPLPERLAEYECRNNRLAQLVLLQDGFSETVAAARARYGADRIGVFIGTSTSGIRQTEIAYRERNREHNELPAHFRFRYTQNIFSVGDFTRRFLELTGPAMVVSTACSSSAKVFAAAWRHIQAGLCDAAIVGGVDSLCLTTLYGFNSLQLVSSSPCRPWDAQRDGINIGEAGGFALLEPPQPGATAVQLAGYGESSDAYHMSTPHPEGTGAILAMHHALDAAQLAPQAIDYINLHGTATASNDAAEDRAVTELFGTQTPCSSTKGWTGHTLGAAGILESVFCFIALEYGVLPATLNLQHKDPALHANVLDAPMEHDVQRVMTNSFGFGGTNCSLIFARPG